MNRFIQTRDSGSEMSHVPLVGKLNGLPFIPATPQTRLREVGALHQKSRLHQKSGRASIVRKLCRRRGE